MSEELQPKVFQTALLDLMISYIIGMKEQNDKYQFGQNLIDILNHNIQDLEFKLERKEVIKQLKIAVEMPNQDINQIPEETKAEFAETMR
jgi:hypothetical protein